MRSLILCEGLDDVLILGYFLHKTQGWFYNPKALFAETYSLPKIDSKKQVLEVYTKDEDVLGIWAVGGRDSFDKAYKFIAKINEQHPEQGINKIFIVTDRDDREIQSCLDSIREKMNSYGLNITDLSNARQNRYTYEIEDETYHLDVIPVIIPFDSNGAIENVLMTGIAEAGEEESYIVDSANTYVDSILNSGKLRKYLDHERKIVKARLSATISITNPDRSTAEFNTLLMSWNWEETEAVQRHFSTITHFLE